MKLDGIIQYNFLKGVRYMLQILSILHNIPPVLDLVLDKEIENNIFQG
jgi:hypothetical protein